MVIVFLSYATKDHFFAELAEIKLASAGITLWRDQGQLRAGTDWRQGIEKAISDSFAVLVALSTNSAESSYVTFEWAYALGKGKAIVPLKLTQCDIHPRLETIQYLDFSVVSLDLAHPVEKRFPRENAVEQPVDTGDKAGILLPTSDDTQVKAILAYLNQQGYQIASFDRLRRRIDSIITDEQFNQNHPEESNFISPRANSWQNTGIR